jgi:diacylglycerol kinase
MKQQRFSIKKRIRSFGFAWNGLKILVREEHNARIHLFATLCVLVAGILLEISTLEWISVVLAIGMVIALEAVNSAIENLADFVSPERHNWIKKIKDLAAAAVLVGALAAFLVGLLVFVPRIWDLFC